MSERTGLINRAETWASATALGMVLVSGCTVAEPYTHVGSWHEGSGESVTLRAGASVDATDADDGWGTDPCSTTTNEASVTPIRYKDLAGGRVVEEIPKAQVPLADPTACPGPNVYINAK